MKENQNISSPKKGMNSDAAPYNLKEHEYSFALNTIFESESGDTYNPKNETSNILAAQFPAGFKVVGVKKDVKDDRTLYWITNPETGVSQIGFIKQGKEYQTLVEDSHDKGLNFSIHKPIKKIVLKYEKLGTTAYWVDNNNPDRYINISRVQEAKTDGKLDVDKLRIDKKHTLPTITPVSIESGGQLQKGIYEVSITYCDKLGNEIAEYISTTNPIHIYDNNDRTMEISELNERTNQAIKLKVGDLDKQYKYYKVIVVQRLLDSTSYFVEGLHPISDDEIIISSLQEKKRTDINELLALKTTWIRSEGITSSNGYLFRYGLTAEKEWNLQPISNLMGSFLKWQTLTAKEDLYSRGESASLYKGYYRDEVYPFSIRFETNTGFKTALTPLVGRPATTYLDQETGIVIDEKATVDNMDVKSVNEFNPECSTEERNEYWQFYNTAHDVKISESEGEFIDVDQVITRYSFQEDIEDHKGGILYMDVSQVDEYNDLRSFIEESGVTPDNQIPRREESLPEVNVEHIVYSEGYGFLGGEWTAEQFSGSGDLNLMYPDRAQTGYNCIYMNDADDLGIRFTPATPITPDDGTATLSLWVIENGNYGDNRSFDWWNVYFEVINPQGETETVPTSSPGDVDRHNWKNLKFDLDYPGASIKSVIIRTRDADRGGLFPDREWKGRFDNIRLYAQDTIDVDEAVFEQEYNNDDIISLLGNDYDDISELPVYDKDSCGAPIRVDQTTLLGDIEGESVELIKRQRAAYTRSRVADYTQIHKTEADGTPEKDEDLDKVYKRNFTKANDCKYAIELGIRDEAIEGGAHYILPYEIKPTEDLLLNENLESEGDGLYFKDKLHKAAVWFRGSLKDKGSAILEISSMNMSDKRDAMRSTLMRVSLYKGRCNNLEFVKSYTVNMLNGQIFAFEQQILTKEVYGDDVHIALDSPIMEVDDKFVTMPVSGSFGVELREVEHDIAIVKYDRISVNKREKYEIDCTFQVPVFNECEPQPYKNGKFAYWESIEDYPPNRELYDSSRLIVEEGDIPEEIKQDFEDYFVSSKVNSRYILKEDTDLSKKPIRHFKFPDFNTAPFMSTEIMKDFTESLIYPLGVTIDKEVVEAFLDIAVKNGLITEDQRKTIVSFEIFRGDRRVNKSILGKGMMYDMYSYEDEISKDEILFPNFPYNDLGENQLLYKNSDQEDFIPHPYGSEGNNRFTLHSPEYDYYNLSMGTEVKVEAYQYGTSKGNFTEVDKHPEWVILGEKSYTIATLLATLEFGLEKAIRFTENSIQASQGFWALFGVTNGTGAVGAGIGLGLAGALEIAQGILFAAPQIGKYRYEWLKIFRDLGQPENFAYQYASEGYYNYALPNHWSNGAEGHLGNTLRAVSTAKDLREGRFNFVEKDGKQLKINNRDREKSILLTFGEDYSIFYPETYKFYDNSNYDSLGSSRGVQSETENCEKGKSQEVHKNIASPYASMKSYVPFQYGMINSIKWLPTSEKIKLGDDNNYTVFGGDIYISRYTFKRKTPIFDTTAFGLPDMLPFEYTKHNNLGHPRFFCNYEVGGEGKKIGDVLFPDFESEYRLDCQTPSSKSYIKSPSKMYLYYYGIPNFLVESEINLNLRYGKKEPENSFYPESGDFNEWTQENNVSIREPNRLFYNNVYSSQPTTAAYRTLPDYFNKREFDVISDSQNGVIYSMQDVSENDLTDPWLVYRPLDYHQFPTTYGKLIDLRGIASSQVLGRFENTTVLFNAVNQYKDAQDAATREMGTGGVFYARPMEFSSTELGYIGTSSHQIISNDVGHFYTDAERGQVFHYTGGKNRPEEISARGMKAWFKEHLPFKVKNPLIANYEDIDIDNAFNGIGITMGWDSKFDRILITKKDYLPLKDMSYYEGKFIVYDCEPISFCKYENKEQTIQDMLDQGYKFIEENCKLTFEKYLETCQYTYTGYKFSEDEKRQLVNEGYTLKTKEEDKLIYTRSVEECDPKSKTAEIKNLLDQGYTEYLPDRCIFSQAQIDILTNDGYIEVSQEDCLKTFEAIKPKVIKGYPMAITEMPDGDILLLGKITGYEGTTYNSLIKMDIDGNVDPNFNSGTGFGGLTANNHTESGLAIGKDGKIYFAGIFSSYDGNPCSNIVRINPDGSFDNTYLIGTGFNDVCTALFIDSQNRALVSGRWSSYNGTARNRLIRLLPDGTVDTSFYNGGGVERLATEILQDPITKKYYLAGYFTSIQGSPYRHLARLNTDGTVDTTFNPPYPYPAASNDSTELALDGNKLVIGGYFNTLDGEQKYMARLNTDGSIDQTFPDAFSGQIHDILVDNGKIITLGFDDEGDSWGLKRFNGDGSLDTSFNYSIESDKTIYTTNLISKQGRYYIPTAEHINGYTGDYYLGEVYDSGEVKVREYVYTATVQGTENHGECDRFFKKEVCSFTGKQAEIDALLADGYELVKETECSRVYEKPLDPSVKNVANTDYVTLKEGGIVVFDVIANDVSATNEPLTINRIATQPALGAVKKVSDTSFQYTHDINKGFGRDAFTYTAINSFGESNEAIVHITVEK